ncbi:DUF5666 domain-containing protein [Zoogloea sp.]|uniref:DUF5666 domain-containing protein n=1 Tax=Zoogloea sp. TaxID=49181 RepID=UPI0035AE24BD
MTSLLSSVARRLLATLTALALAACGGGDSVDVAGVGSGGSGVASGSVTGFGSVIVDGVEYDDTAATREAEGADGARANTAVKLGQRVRVQYAGGRVATRIEVQAQLVGPVTAAPGAGGVLAVLGQRVRVVTGSGDLTQSSPTVLDGYSGVAAIAAGDEVEVHGAWAYDSATATNVLVATRIEKRADRPDPVQLGGVVTAIDGTTIRLNSASGTPVRAASLPTLAVGDVVRVWANRSALAVSPVLALRVAADSVAADLAGNASVSVSGLASHYDPVGRTVEVQGVKVKLADGVTVDEDALARGGFVTVSLSRGGATPLASAVSQRSSGSDLGRTVEVKGVTRGVDWTAPTVSFVLRGTPIQASAGAIAPVCRSVAVSADVLVEVRGSTTGSGAAVTAASVSCSTAFTGAPTADYTGTLAAIDTAGRSLRLLVSATGQHLVAVWDDKTYFEQHPASLPIGLRVEVEGVMDKGSNTLRLSKVRAAD